MGLIDFNVRGINIVYDKLYDTLTISKSCDNVKYTVLECKNIKYICDAHDPCGVKIYDVSKIKKRKFSGMIRTYGNRFNKLRAIDVVPKLGLWS